MSDIAEKDGQVKKQSILRRCGRGIAVAGRVIWRVFVLALAFERWSNG